MPDHRDQTVSVSFHLNGRPVTTEVPTSTILADLLRNTFDKSGVKVGCARSVCGACTVLIDGRPAASCSAFAFEVDGCRVETIEGLAAEDGALDPVQEAFADLSAFQCGYCTSGMIMMTKALLAHDPDPDDATIVEWISSNICRCTGYSLIIEAAKEAARRTRARTGERG
jgi:carbon-monoxide dehydrogenase small subunit